MRTIEFFSSLEGLADAVPIIPASEFRPKWMEAAREDYIRVKNLRLDKFTHIYRCPGIFDLYNEGFIVPMWHDLIIKTKINDNKAFGWAVPSEDLQPSNRSMVDALNDNITRFIPRRPWSMQKPIKLNTPWHIVAPKGVRFMMMPIAYPDSFEYEHCPGILDPGYSSEINLQMWWNKLDGEHLIKAGTPMVHMIPLTNEKFKYTCRTMTDNDLKWLEKRRFFMNFTFTQKRNFMKDMYNKFFNKE